jgi:hypothetical protein
MDCFVDAQVPGRPLVGTPTIMGVSLPALRFPPDPPQGRIILANVGPARRRSTRTVGLRARSDVLNVRVVCGLTFLRKMASKLERCYERPR